MDDKIKFVLGERIKKIRNKRKMTQADLAEATELSVSYISYIENGMKYLSVDSLIKIAKALDTTPDILLGDIVGDANSVQISYFNEIIHDCSVKECEQLSTIMKVIKDVLRSN